MIYTYDGDKEPFGSDWEGDVDHLTTLKRRVRKQRSRIHQLEGQSFHESELRDQHPGLKEIWDQYQTLLKLVDK